MSAQWGRFGFAAILKPHECLPFACVDANHGLRCKDVSARKRPTASANAGRRRDRIHSHTSMKSHEPMERSNRRLAWIALVVAVLGLLLLASPIDVSKVSSSIPIELILIPLTGLSGMAFGVACFDDLSKRRFRDPNTKMRWSIAFTVCAPLSLVIYLLYFGYILVRRERSHPANAHQTKST